MARSPSKKLRAIIFGSKKLTTTQAKYCAPKHEMYAAHHFILKYHSYLCPRKFTLRVDNQALSWLKAYSTDQVILRRWIMALEKYHFKIEHRPRTQHRNANGLSKRTNDYKHRAALLGLQPAVVDKWIFLRQDEFDQTPVAPWFDINGKIIPNHLATNTCQILDKYLIPKQTATILDQTDGSANQRYAPNG